VEILAIMIRENKDIKEIKIGKTENKISQHADNTEVLLEGDEQSFVKTLEVINLFGKVSGLKLNTNKSCAIWLVRKTRKQYICPICTWNGTQNNLKFVEYGLQTI
jgi:hypothetical protein